MESLALNTRAPKAHWEDNTRCIYVVESKKVTPRVKQTDITFCFIQEKFDNGLFIPRYENSSVTPVDMFTKPCTGPIISRSTKYMNGCILYLTSGTEHYQFRI